MSRTPSSDAELVAAVRAGSDAAFEAIVRRHRPALTRFAAKLLGPAAQDADDVVQDALVRALRGLRASDRPIALRPWLYTIVRNRAYDHARTARRHAAESDERLALVPARGHEPADRAAAREELRRVVAEIGRLPERQRVALVRRELGGASHAQLAGELGTSVGAVKSLLVRGRATVAAAIAA